MTKLSKARPRSAYVQATADEGTRFGALVQAWLEGREPAAPAVLDDPWAWFEYMRATWSPPPGVRCEVPLGLSVDGDFVEVVETQPHVYTPVGPGAGAQLATAGRADLMWEDIPFSTVAVADLKRSAFKYGDPARHPQLMALGCAAALKTGARWILLGLYGAKDGAWEWSDHLHVEELLPEVLEMCALDENTPTPGPWCAGCYEARGCEAAEVAP